MPRRYHASRSGSTNGRHADRASERAVADAVARLERIYAEARARDGARLAASALLDAATRVVAEARASRARAAALLATRVARLEREARRARGR